MNLNHPDVLPRVEELIERYAIVTFVETGTGYGLSLGAMYDLGLRCYSCDVDPVQVQRAKRRCPGAEVWCSDSLRFLRDGAMLSMLFTIPRLWFLDAHFPDPGLPGEAWPVREELGIIKGANPVRDVILCDDMLDRRVTFDWREYAAMFADTHDADLWDGGMLSLTPKNGLYLR